MKAITIRQPYASLIAAGVKTIITRPRPTKHRGRVAIHAGLQSARFSDAYDAWCALAAHMDLAADGLYYATTKGHQDYCDPLPLGAVVASAVLTDCAPIGGPFSFSTGIYEGDEGDFAGQPVVVRHDAMHETPEALILSNADTSNTDITAQLPFGDFSPGRWALLLDDIAPTTERCPWCWGKGYDSGQIEPEYGTTCPVCEGNRRCDPVPARGQQAVPWTWEP